MTDSSPSEPGSFEATPATTTTVTATQPMPPGGPSEGPALTVTVADEIAAAALSVPGVASLHSGSFGEVATYLPGRRVAGVKTGGELTEVHLVVDAGTPVLPVAELVRAAVAVMVTTPVDVYIEDIAPPDTAV